MSVTQKNELLYAVCSVGVVFCCVVRVVSEAVPFIYREHVRWEVLPHVLLHGDKS